MRNSKNELIKNTNCIDPFSGVSPKLYIINAAGDSNPTAPIHTKTMILLS